MITKLRFRVFAFGARRLAVCCCLVLGGLLPTACRQTAFTGQSASSLEPPGAPQPEVGKVGSWVVVSASYPGRGSSVIAANAADRGDKGAFTLNAQCKEGETFEVYLYAPEMARNLASNDKDRVRVRVAFDEQSPHVESWTTIGSDMASPPDSEKFARELTTHTSALIHIQELGPPLLGAFDLDGSTSALWSAMNACSIPQQPMTN